MLLRRPTAIEILSPERVSSAALERFEREVPLTAKLSHPNVVSVFDFGRSEQGAFYYAMEFLDGITLQNLVDSDGLQGDRGAAQHRAARRSLRARRRRVLPAHRLARLRRRHDRRAAFQASSRSATPPSERAAGVPRQLEAIVLRCLEKHPTRRPGSARELRRALDECSDVPPWTRSDSEAWWQGRTSARLSTGAPSPFERTLAVDLRELRARA